MSVKLKVPVAATLVEDGVKKIQYFKLKHHLDADGTIAAPRWLVPELLSRGCSYADPAAAPPAASMREHLAATPPERSHELSLFLNAHGEQDHFFEKNTHVYSAELRAMGAATPRMIPNPGAEQQNAEAKAAGHAATVPTEYEFFGTVADELDRLHQLFHKKGRGRPVVLSHEEKRTKALALHDKVGAG